MPEQLLGSSPEAGQPFRGPGYEGQGELLNQYMLGQFLTPEMLQAQQQNTQRLQSQYDASGGQRSQTQLPYGYGTGQGGIAGWRAAMNPYGQPGYSGGDETLRNQLEQSQRIQGLMEGGQPYMNTDRFQAGQELAGQIAPVTGTAASLMGSQNQLADLQKQLAGYQSWKPTPTKGPFGGMGTMFQMAENKENLANTQSAIDALTQQIAQQQASIAETTPQFEARNPFQFQNSMKAFQYQDPTNGMTAQQLVGDAFTPQMAIANQEAQRQGELQREQIMADMNRRGMLTSGATSRAMQMQQRDQGDRLANLSNQFGAQQAQQMLGANQYLQGMGWNQQQAQAGEQARQQSGDWARQSAQAEEIFRQQGATDAQASQMAQMAMQRQQQNFGQQQAGRQAGLQEYALQQQQQRQPMEDLFRLYQLSTGGQPGTPGSQGMLPGLIQGGAGIASLFKPVGGFCLPKGTQIETEDSTKSVEDIVPGDFVRGGMVQQISRTLRPIGHEFYKHVFQGGKEVVMSDGHPFTANLESKEQTESASECTYDIRTTEGFYYVNGVMLHSTLDRR